MNTIEVCLSPKLFENYSLENKTIVVVDILRATTIITTMFHNGVQKIIPVRTLNEAKEYKTKGYLVAAERNGKKLEFADFDNSPFTFTKENIKGKTVVYSSTNGTNTINLVKNANQVLIASFLNLSAIMEYLATHEKDIIILCSGWKGNYCTEDTLFAGALTNALLSYKYKCIDDSAKTSVMLWNSAKSDLTNFIKEISQYKRLIDLGIPEEIIEYCFTIDATTVIPLLFNASSLN